MDRDSFLYDPFGVSRGAKFRGTGSSVTGDLRAQPVQHCAWARAIETFVWDSSVSGRVKE